jgi:hypothetical protein
MKMDAKRAIGATVNQNARKLAGSSSSPPAAQGKKAAGAAKPKARPNARKAMRQPSQSSGVPSKAEKLVCRYCGSDDLSPSFKKRRDARCRACFKKRYGSTVQRKKAIRIRKTKAAK